MTALAPFAASLAAHPDRAALIAADGEVLSFAALDAWAAALAEQYQRRDVAAGSRVLVALGVSPTLYAVLIALWRIGAVAVFPEPSAGLAGLRHAIATSAPGFYVGPAWLGVLAAALSLRPRLAAGLPHARATAPATAPASWPDAHPALISFTSGSTGQHKGILRSHGFLLAQHRALVPLLTPEAPSVDLVCLPLFVLVGLGLGLTSVLPDAALRDPATVDAGKLARQIARHGVTRLLAPPYIAARLSGEAAFEQLRQIYTGGGPVWPEVMRQLLEAAPRAEIFAVYGSTEAEPIAHQKVNDLGAADWQAIAAGDGLPAGWPIAEIALRIRDSEIQVAGAHVIEGYLEPAQDHRYKCREAGRIWHRTGDAGRLAADGRLWLLGRLDGRAGEWFPFAVEIAAQGWPGVRQAALIADSGRVRLVLAGAADQAAAWRDRLRAFPGIELLIVPSVPLDRRHRSKVDYARLRRLLST